MWELLHMIAPFQARYLCISFYFQALKTSGAKQLPLLKPEAAGLNRTL